MMMPDKEIALMIHRLMARTRALCTVLELKGERVDGPVLTGLGAEGLSVGIGMALHMKGILKESLLHGNQRSQYGFALVKNLAFADSHDHAKEILKNYALTNTSASQGEDGNIHYGCLDHGILAFATSDMGRMIPVLVGMSEEMRRRRWIGIEHAGERPVAIGDFGEGALNQGCIAESMNWVAASNCRLNDDEMREHEKSLDRVGRELRVLRGAPMIFTVNRNQFSIYTREREEHGRSDIAARAYGYGDMRAVHVQGYDVFDVIEKVTEAICHAQALRSSLLDIETFRLSAHNRVQISRDRNNPKIDEGKIRGLAPEEFARGWALFDPLKNCRTSVAAWGYAREEELAAIEAQELNVMGQLFEQVFKEEPEPTLEHRSKKTVMIPHVFSMPSAMHTEVLKKQMHYNGAFVESLRGILRKDPGVTAFGQDIHLGGVLGETIGKGDHVLSEEFGEVRVHTTPISEEAATSVGAGRSLYGGQAFVFYQFAPFWADSYPAWRSVIATNYWQKGLRFNVKGIFPFGVVYDGGSGEYHEACVEAPLLSMGGIVLLFPRSAYEVAGMMNAAHEYPGPVAIFLQTYAFGKSEFGAEVPTEPFIIPFGQANIRRSGNDVSVFAYGAAAVRAAENEAAFLERKGIDIEVVDVQCLEPLDKETLFASARKTGRVIILHEATWRNGGGVYIKHQLDEMGVGSYSRTGQTAHLLCSEDNPIPTKIDFLWARLPFERYVVQKEDDFGIPRTILRSTKLARLARELKEVYR